MDREMGIILGSEVRRLSAEGYVKEVKEI